MPTVTTYPGVFGPYSPITFTRASTATFFNASGVLTSAAINEARLDYNPATLAARGFLIEEQRTNLVLQSEDFATTWTTNSSPTITTNTTVAPNGTTTADTIASTAAGSYVAQTITFTGDGTKTYSFFIKAGTSGNTRVFIRDTTASFSRGQVDIVWTGGVPSPTVANGSLQSLQSCPNGWYRVSVIVDSVVAANTNQIRIQPDNVSGTGNIIIWGFQAENAAFSTSYISTTTAAATRSADLASVNTLSPWFNAAEGTVFTNFILQNPPAINLGSVCAISNGTINERILISMGTGSGGNINAVVGTGGVIQAQTINGGLATAGEYRYANAYKVNDFASVVNGGAAVTDSSGSVSVVDRLILGANQVGNAGFLNGHLRRLTYYPRRLSNAELQAITA